MTLKDADSSTLKVPHPSGGRQRPELIVKFWPPSVTARGVEALETIRRPLAFAVYSRPVVAIVMALIFMWAGRDEAILLFRMLKSWF